MRNYPKIVLFLLLFLATINSSAQNYNIDFRSRTPYTALAGLWGYVDSLGNEYALVGANDHLSIVDVSDPTNPIKKFSVPGPNSIWREVRTKGKYAYVTTEGGGGLTIVDLRYLPDTIYHKQYTGDGTILNQITDIHTLHVEKNRLYLYGSDLFLGKTYVLNVEDPWNPLYMGVLSSDYTHDGFVKNDTVYAAQIYNGFVEIIDARNPSNPVIISTQNTPKQFTHNTWLSTDGKTMYTTDEIDGSWVTAYDISDFNNIKELDRYRRDSSNSIPHNVYVLKDSSLTGSSSDYLWTAYYTDGVTLVDASKPDNLVEIGRYDTSPNFSGGGTDGAWGVYPYLPSGNILVSDKQMGLYVLSPSYQKPCYLEGIVRDAATNLPIVGARIKVLGKSSLNDLTNLSGAYKNGTVDPGTYEIEISGNTYAPKKLNVVLQSGQLTTFNVTLTKQAIFPFNTVLKDSSGQVIPLADFIIRNAEYTHVLKSDENGLINIPVFYEGKYAMYVGKYGYRTQFIDYKNYSTVNDIPNIVLAKGYYDDFFFDFNWQTESTANTGLWVRAKPIPTAYLGVIVNPEVDAEGDIGTECYVTGNAVGSVNFDDIDKGVVELISPLFDLTTYENPYVNLNWWFTNIAATGMPNDTFTISLSNGTQTAILEQSISNNANKGKWNEASYRVKDYLPITSTMKLMVKASDLAGSDHITEAAIDKFFVSDSTATGINNKSNTIYAIAYPNPTSGKVQVSYSFRNATEGKVRIYDVLGNTVFEKALTDSYGMLSISLENQGMYFIRIESNQEQKILKIVRQ